MRRARRPVRPRDRADEGFERAFLVGAGFALAGALLTLVLISSRDSREHARAAQSGEAIKPMRREEALAMRGAQAIAESPPDTPARSA